jgi:hypothetical protein
MSSEERSEKLTQLIGQYLFDLTLGEYPTFQCDAEILETTPTSLVTRWSSQFILPENDRVLPGLSIPEKLCFEEKTAKLEWPTEEGCTSLSNDFLLTFINEELDVEEDVPWDDPRISDDTIAAVVEQFDEVTEGQELIEYFGNAKDVRYALYPKRLRLHIRRLVVAAMRYEMNSTDR